MNPRKSQIPPPSSWIDFEKLCHQLFKSAWDDPSTKMNGRLGQAQHGVDIYGSPRSVPTSIFGVQCKGKEVAYGAKATTNELESEAEKARNFSPGLSHWIYATTAPRDAMLQQRARELSVSSRDKGGFTIEYLGWDDLTDLLCDHPNVLKEFYPHHAYDIPALIEAVQANYAPKRHSITGCWSRVDYSGQRDLRAALLGLRLGPQDAHACPQLVESGRLVGLLSATHSARLLGAPGAGKSVCMHQAAFDFAKRGYTVFQLVNPKISMLPPLPELKAAKVLLLIDDAHLMAPEALAALERRAAPNLCVLSSLNRIEDDREHTPGSIALDERRAVKTIAAALKSDLRTTIEVVRHVDRSVGLHMLDEDLDDRIDHAADQAKSPWHFCFILGGGWKRASVIADNARANSADLILAVAAARQIASRDDLANSADLEHLLPAVSDQLEVKLEWLSRNRMLIGEGDYRTPHQRFAAVLIPCVLEHQNDEGKQKFADVLNALITDPQMPVLGIRNLLHEIGFAGGYRQFTRLISSEALATLAARLWEAEMPEERNAACLTLAEYGVYGTASLRAALESETALLADWTSKPDHPSGYGIGRLYATLRQDLEDFGRGILNSVDPTAVSRAVSSATPESAYTLAELVIGIGQVADADWRAKASKALKPQSCLHLAAHWPIDQHPSSFARYCQALVWWDKELSVQLAEVFAPHAAKMFANDPMGAIYELNDIVSSVLGILDVLNVYPKPSKRNLDIGRAYLSLLRPSVLAEQILETPIRRLQNASFSLDFTLRCRKRLYVSVVETLDWTALSEKFDGEWAAPAHDLEVFLGVLSATPRTRGLASAFIRKNLDRVDSMPPRWVLIAPEAAVEHVKAGKQIRLCQQESFNWTFAAFTIYLMHKECPDKLPSMLDRCKGAIAKSVSYTNGSGLADAADAIWTMKEYAPEFLTNVLDSTDPATLERCLIACLRNNPKYDRRSASGGSNAAAIIVEHCVGIESRVGEIARSLRSRFPRRSIPKPSRLADWR